MLTSLDYAVLLILSLCALRGLWRGLLSECFALIGWIVAVLVAARYMHLVAPYMPVNWPGGGLTQFLCAFAIIALAVRLLASVLEALSSRLISASRLRTLDGALGLLFGLLRGVAWIIVLATAAGLTDLPRQPFWRNALSQPYIEYGVNKLKAQLPEVLTRYLG
jgi:membrane protein required for colicin V production